MLRPLQKWYFFPLFHLIWKLWSLSTLANSLLVQHPSQYTHEWILSTAAGMWKPLKTIRRSLSNQELVIVSPVLIPLLSNSKQEIWDPTLEADRQCRTRVPRCGASGHTHLWVLRAALLSTPPWLSPNCCSWPGNSSITLDQKCSFPQTEYSHCYPAFLSDQAIYPLIRAQSRCILIQKLG